MEFLNSEFMLFNRYILIKYYLHYNNSTNKKVHFCYCEYRPTHYDKIWQSIAHISLTEKTLSKLQHNDVLR